MRKLVSYLKYLEKKIDIEYIIYNQINYEQLKLIRIGLKSELLQNGLRKQVIDIIKASAKGEFDEALELARKHLENISKEEKNAE